MNKIILLFLICLLPLFVFSQVGVGTTTPAGSLDVTTSAVSPDGLLVPRVALVATNVATVITPTVSELVYNTFTSAAGPNQVTPGFYYWNGTLWIRLSTGNNNDWSITGNTGTVPGTNFIGTIDNQDFIVRTNNAQRFNFTNNGRLRATDNGTTALPTFSWNGDTGTGFWRPAANTLAFSTNTLERMRIVNGGVVVGSTAPFAGDRFSSYGLANEYAVNGYSLGAGGVGVYGENPAGGIGIHGLTNGNLSIGVLGESIGTNGTGVLGYTNNTGGDGVYGETTVAGRFGVWGVNNNATGFGVYGSSIGGSGTGVYGNTSGANGYGVWGNATGASGIGIRGVSSGATAGFGAFGRNTNTAGTGVIGIGNNVPGTYLTAGSGGAFSGSTTGTVSFATAAANGVGLYASGNNLGAVSLGTVGVGGAFNANRYGVTSIVAITGAGNNAVDRATFNGQYVSGGTTLDDVYVGARIGGVNYKILGTGGGSVSTTMKTSQGEKILFAPEAPENWFFDLGEVQLVNGVAKVTLDPIFVECISDSKPFKVFVQGGESTLGSIRITRNQSDKSFLVEDLGGASNGIVQYSIYAIWKGKDNIRFPELSPESRLKQNSIESTSLNNDEDKITPKEKSKEFTPIRKVKENETKK